ncbi:hypothetical protein ABZ487_30215 [Micromonospora aurantiaca]|uniref:hypothetical protein n=1 Tax=Micromonospora aurantiaca (nom. illeg.) TaxID=47850 RepID=UPI0033E274E9
MERIDESGLDPRADYDEIYRDGPDHDNEHLDALVDGDVAITATYTVSSARYLATGTTLLGEALAGPYSLRTTADAETVLAALRDHLTGLADVADGLNQWLGAAHERGELASTPADLRGQLDQAARALRAAEAPLADAVVPADASPPIDHEALITGVTEHLAARGIRVTRVRVFGDQTQWDLGDELYLVLFRSQGWELIDDGNAADPRIRLPYCQFVHPAHIAGLVADALTGPR